MATWNIKGETGKAFGDATVALSSIDPASATVSFRSLEADTFRYTIRTDTPTTTTNVPEEGQTITLLRDASIFFHGHVTSVRRLVSAGAFGVEVTVSGPWWWLDRIGLTSDRLDGTGNTDERISIQFATGDMQTHIETLIDRSITLGAPMQRGTVGAYFDIPRVTWNQMTCGMGLSEFVRLVPDAMLWFDYSTSPPTCNVTRRSDATVRTIDLIGGSVVSLDVEPDYEMQVEQVRLPYVVRGADGRTVFVEQSSGDQGTAQAGAANSITLRAGASKSNDAYNGLVVTITAGTGNGQTRTITDYVGSTKVATVTPNWTTPPDGTSVYSIGSGIAQIGKLEMVTVSGPELDTFLPNDFFDSYSIQTVAAGSVTATQVVGLIPEVQSSRANYDGRPVNGEMFLGDGNPLTYSLTSSMSPTGGTRTIATAPIRYINAIGTEISPAGKYVLLTADAPDWLAETGAVVTPARMTGQAFYEWYSDAYSFPYNATDRVSMAPLSEWAAEFPWSGSISPVGFDDQLRSGGQSPPAFHDHFRVHLYWLNFEVDVVLIDDSYPSATTIYRPADYDFINPPEGLAYNLQQAQGFLPYRGNIVLVDDTPGAIRYRGCTVNVSNSIAAHSSMLAMVDSEELDLLGLTTTVTLGTPPRNDYRTFVDKIRRTPQDNIVYL